jgi:hypothetical protein
VLIAGGIAYLAWRRNRADRLFLGLLVCILGWTLLLDTQGYYDHFNALYMVPIGPLLVDGLHTVGVTRGRNRHSLWAGVCVLVVMAGQMAGVFIDWPTFGAWLRTGELPPYLYLYEELGDVLEPFISEDDVVVSTSQLLWTFPESPQVVFGAAEATVLRERPDIGASEPVEVWEDIRPTVVVYVENEMSITPGLEAYMAQHEFEQCQELEFLNHHIEIYRETCPALPGSAP